MDNNLIIESAGVIYAKLCTFFNYLKSTRARKLKFCKVLALVLGNFRAVSPLDFKK